MSQISSNSSKRMPCLLVFSLIVCVWLGAVTENLEAQTLLKLGGVDVAPESRFTLDVGAGVLGLDGFDQSRFALTVTPHLELYRSRRGKLDLALPVFWIPNSFQALGKAPCQRGVCASIWLEAPFDARDLEAGPALAFAPALEWTFATASCVKPSLFAGVGLWHEKGRTSKVEVFGELTTEDTTSPLFTAGVALERRLTRHHRLRFEARVLTVFYDERTAEGLGERIELGGGSVTSGLLSIGLKLGF